jgi:aminopeptidase N
MTNRFYNYSALAILVLTASASQTAGSPIVASDQDMVSNVVTLTPDFTTQTVSGTQSTRVQRIGPKIQSIRFSNNAMMIDSASINDQPVQAGQIGEMIVFPVPKRLQRARNLVLTVTYRGKPAKGMTWSENLVFSSYYGCEWMFCGQDTPGDKSDLTLSLNLPGGMDSIAAGTRTASPGGQSWQTTQPFSPYLFGFVAGQFETVVQRHKGSELAYVNATGKPADLQALFGTTPAMVDFFVDKAGIPLPARRYTQVLVNGGEAQEHATYSLIGTDNIDPILSDPKEDWVIAHELAHQWWGNSVTTATWQDFWLNEGMTVFMTAAWKEHSHGRAAYDREMELARARLARAREAGWDKPLAFQGEYPSLRWRRAVQYSKGALFMDHLRTQLGETAFWEGLRAYTRKHAGRTVVSMDLQRAMEDASGRDLLPTFANWVYDEPWARPPVDTTP